MFDGPHHSVMHVERCAPTLVAGHPTGAVLGGGTTGRYGPGAADGRFVMKRLIRLGPFTDGRGAVGSVDGGPSVEARAGGAVLEAPIIVAATVIALATVPIDRITCSSTRWRHFPLRQ
ncbi:hypothetical protein BZL30_6160 [Mycobacterium kansasii]|uniref:Uncharacterized protein n=1 Tax=Mycobacterium kansasii TaxID=1768 RepID=A0A1V3WUD4_MYCKA|nr:hypothetical protein BZL30_6160 [Mycobacterium kansasii]